MEEKFRIISAEYITSAVAPEQFLESFSEVAFIGRSNVGKSSLINSLTNQKHLAKTSSTPGLTKMVNYFLINKNLIFVDLPGYGYSKTGKKHQELWSTLIESYLQKSKQLKLVIFLVDIRHEPSEQDVLMQKYLFYNNIPYKIVATKADKIAKSKIQNYTSKIAKKLSVAIGNIYAYSSESAFGREKLLKIIDDYLHA